MTIKTFISLTDAQEAFARGLVEQGRYSSLSAVLQQGLEVLRTQTEANDTERDGLRALLQRRRGGAFIPVGKGKAHTKAMIAAKRAADGV